MGIHLSAKEDARTGCEDRFKSDGHGSETSREARLLYRRPGDRKLKNEGRLVWLREKKRRREIHGGTDYSDQTMTIVLGNPSPNSSYTNRLPIFRKSRLTVDPANSFTCTISLDYRQRKTNSLGTNDSWKALVLGPNILTSVAVGLVWIEYDPSNAWENKSLRANLVLR